MAVKKKIPMRKCVGCGEMKPKKELIRIESDVTDRRIQHIYLTADAIEEIKILKKEIRKINEDILLEIPKEDIQKMEETLIKIRDHFKEKNEEVCL